MTLSFNLLVTICVMYVAALFLIVPISRIDDATLDEAEAEAALY